MDKKRIYKRRDYCKPEMIILEVNSNGLICTSPNALYYQGQCHSEQW